MEPEESAPVMLSSPSFSLIDSIPKSIESTRAQPLFSTTRVPSLSDSSGFSSQLILIETTLQTLSKSFLPTHRLVILAVAGPSGVGKSTWLNAIALHLDPTIENPPFECGESQLGVTKGMFVYPKPLSIGPETDLLLCDMEGMDGIREDLDRGETSKLVKRTFFVSLATASMVCVHSGQRIQGSQIEGLSDMYSVIQELSETLDLDVPDLSLFIGDCNQIADEPALKSVIQKHCNIPESFLSLLKINPRGRPTSDFLESGEIRSLLKGQYFSSLETFLSHCPQHVKNRPGFLRPITISELVSDISNLVDFVNSKDYVNRFLKSMEETVFAVLIPESETLLEKFRTEVLSSAIEFKAENEVETFEKTAKVLKTNSILALQSLIQENFRPKFQTNESVLKIQSDFDRNLTYSSEIELFSQRHEKHKAELRHLAEIAELKALEQAKAEEIKKQKKEIEELKSQESSLFSESHISGEKSVFDGSSSVSFEQSSILSSLLSPSLNHSSVSFYKPPMTQSLCPGPLKKDGTPDMRYKVNREAAGYSIQMTLNAENPSFSQNFAVPLKKDGTPDMRFSINKQLFGSGSTTKRRSRR